MSRLDGGTKESFGGPRVRRGALFVFEGHHVGDRNGERKSSHCSHVFQGWIHGYTGSASIVEGIGGRGLNSILCGCHIGQYHPGQF
eukprot:scaffold82566_cov63-Attheya_sp.AAC.2